MKAKIFLNATEYVEWINRLEDSLEYRTVDVFDIKIIHESRLLVTYSIK